MKLSHKQYPNVEPRTRRELALTCHHADVSQNAASARSVSSQYLLHNLIQLSVRVLLQQGLQTANHKFSFISSRKYSMHKSVLVIHSSTN